MTRVVSEPVPSDRGRPACDSCSTFVAVSWVIVLVDGGTCSATLCELCAHAVEVHCVDIGEAWEHVCDCSWLEIYGSAEFDRRARIGLAVPAGHDREASDGP